MRAFFNAYLSILKVKDEGKENAGILIDSTGLSNSIHFSLTAVSNHNGMISEEVRLIYVVQQNTRRSKNSRRTAFPRSSPFWISEI